MAVNSPNSVNVNPRRGEVWWVDFRKDPKPGVDPVGDEKDKIRPAVVISSDSARGMRVRIVVPIGSHTATRQPWLVPVVPDHNNLLDHEGTADVLSVRSIALERFRKKIGRMAAEDLEEIVIALAALVELPNSSP